MRRLGLALVLTFAIAAPAHAALPVVYSAGYAAVYGLSHTDGPPPGANNFACKPTAKHPRPVVLVHGTFENMAYNWAALSPLLVNDGYCVFALNYGFNGTPPTFPGASQTGGIGDIPASAAELQVFVTKVLKSTGARRVDIVGHSQGGMMPRYYLRFLGGAKKVHQLIGLSASNHGTTVDGATALIKATPQGEGLFDTVCHACDQQLVGSPFLAKLNAGGDTVQGVKYTVIETKYDEVVTPYTSAFLKGAHNITLQDTCKADFSEHLATPFDRNALRDVTAALAGRKAKPACFPVAPVAGGG